MSRPSNPSCQSVAGRAERLGLRLSTASRNTQMDALSSQQPKPRWELSDGKHQSTVRGFLTLSEVARALDERETISAS